MAGPGRGIFDAFEDTVSSPLFLGGAALLSGDGFGGMQQGMQAGHQFAQQRQRKADQAQQKQAFDDLFTSGRFQQMLPQGMPELARASGPAAGIEMLAQAYRDRQGFDQKKQLMGYEHSLRRADPMNALDAEYKRAQIDKMRRDGLNDLSTPEGRARMAAQYGLKPDDLAYRQYVLTGKMPREDQQSLTATDKKAILEADDAVNINNAVITALDQAETLNPRANSGFAAGTRAWLGNNLPDVMVPDELSSPDSSAATVNFENLVLGQALSQLKATFGAAPTEGERKILVDLQASAEKPPHVRAEILARAKAAAQKRLDFARQQAANLRGGSYYKPGGAPGAPSAASGGAGPQSTRQIGGRTFVQINGQWYEQ